MHSYRETDVFLAKLSFYRIHQTITFGSCGKMILAITRYFTECEQASTVGTVWSARKTAHHRRQFQRKNCEEQQATKFPWRTNANQGTRYNSMEFCENFSTATITWKLLTFRLATTNILSSLAHRTNGRWERNSTEWQRFEFSFSTIILCWEKFM